MSCFLTGYLFAPLLPKEICEEQIDLFVFFVL